MHQSRDRRSTDPTGGSELLVSLFPTEMGWFGFLGQRRTISAAVIGHPSSASARNAIRKSINSSESVDSNSFAEEDWFPELREGLQEYAAGSRVEFTTFDLQLPRQTLFRDKVLAAVRLIRYGETTSYGELAMRVGHPRAARAVGTVMSTNRFPILIPCHRVLAAGSKLGGYSSPTGTKLKQRLLDMEQAG